MEGHGEAGNTSRRCLLMVEPGTVLYYPAGGAIKPVLTPCYISSIVLSLFTGLKLSK